MSRRPDPRAEGMSARYEAGETLAAIAAYYGLTRERVRQILRKHGGPTADAARRARAGARAAADAQVRASILEWLDDRPGQSRQDVATHFGIPESEISRLLGGAASRLLIRAQPGEPQFSDGEICDLLAYIAEEEGEPLSSDTYDSVYLEYGGPVSGRVIQRFGSWNNACRAAGLETNQGRPSYSRRWTEGDLVEAVAAYLQSPGSNGTYRGYETWARRTPDAPSAQTVRNMLGPWSAAKTAAQAWVVALRRRGSDAD
jgi:transcriptional regulator with XRE-family HTH domain